MSALLVLAALVAGTLAATTCHSFSVNATPSAGAAPLCPAGAGVGCTFVADIAIDVDVLTMSRFDGWFGPDSVRLSSQTSGAITNSLGCSTPGGTVLLLTAQTIYTGGSLTLSWVYELASPSCAAPAAWYGLTPTSVTLGGVLPGGTTLTGAASPTPALNNSAIPCPQTTPICLDTWVSVANGSGSPTVTGCPLVGPCDFHLFASFVPATLRLQWLDVLGGPMQASLLSATGLPGVTARCTPGTSVLSLGNTNYVTAQWPLAAECVVGRAAMTAPAASGDIDVFLLNNALALGVYAGSVSGNNSLDLAAVACNATYSPTPTVSQSATTTGTGTRTMTPSNLPTPSQTPSVSATRTSTRTPTQTPSESPTPTSTRTPTQTPSGTLTQTRTASKTPTPSVTPSKTPTVSLTSTPTSTVTSSQTPSTSQAPTVTATPALTGPATPSQTALPTDTRTQTATNTRTRSPTRTSTASASATPSTSASPGVSASATRTASETPSPSHTRTASPTRSATRTPSPTPSATPSIGFTPSPQPSGGGGGGGHDKLSTAQIVGIVLGSVGTAALLALLAMALLAWLRPLAPAPPRRPGAVRYVSVDAASLVL